MVFCDDLLSCKQVKIVKCIVENIVVDITFNQIGGLSTLCFFEQVYYSLFVFLWVNPFDIFTSIMLLRIS